MIRYGIYDPPASSGTAELAIPTFTNCPAFAAGRLRSTNPYSSVKIAVFAPIPSANVSTATMVNTEFFRSIRRPKRTSWSKVSRKGMLRTSRTGSLVCSMPSSLARASRRVSSGDMQAARL